MPANADPRYHQPPPFRVDVHPERDVVRVAVAGELDLATASVLERRLHDLRGAGFDRVVLDLRELTFIDSSGIRIVLAERRFADATDHELSLVNVAPAVHRALEMCGLLERLGVDPV